MPINDVTIAALRMLRVVAQTGSFAAAGEDLGYSQSAVSRQIAALEKATGETLFERGRRGVILTAAGEVLLGTATRVVNELDGAQQQLGGLRDQVAGRVSAGAFPSAAAALMPRAIAAVLDRHPNLHVSIVEAASPTLLRRVRSGRLDLAVVAVDADPAQSGLTDLNCYELRRIGLFVAVPDAHPLARRRRVRPSELVDDAWIVGEGTPGDPQFAAWPTLTDARIAYSTRYWPTRLGLVAAGLGISLVPGAATPSVPAGVTVLAVDDPAPSGRSGLIVTAETETAQAALLVAALQNEAESISDQLNDRLGGHTSANPPHAPRPAQTYRV